jgi:hypothetical protein
MSMMWVKKQSKWVIVVAALLIGGSLIMMDLPSSQGMKGHAAVGEVDGEEIPVGVFQQQLQGYLRSEEARTGHAPEGARYAEIREELFQNNVQSILLGKLVKKYALRASADEMRDWLLRNPMEVAYSIAQYEGPENVPPFLTDSTRFSPQAYQAWLSQGETYDHPGVRVIEERLKANVIPQFQIQQIFYSQIHRTDLEEAFLLETREDKANLRYYHVDAQNFPVGDAPTEEALKAHFEANPDSFWFSEEGARLSYVRLPLVPSAADSALMRDFANELHERATGGESFEELAKSYSSDAATAAEGGRLPAASAAEWEPAFAAAAFALAPGQVSAPVLTPSGWHLIKLHSKSGDKAEVSHILLTITTGTETIDGVMSKANALKEQADKDGLLEAAKAAGLTADKTPVFGRSQRAPLGRYVQGLTSFAFSPMERKAKISEPLQNDDAVYVLERDASFSAGRDFERARDAIALDYARSQALKAARAEAERVRPEIAAAATAPERVGQAVLATAEAVSADGYAPGFGFGDAALFRALRQKVGEWGPVIPTPEGAVIVQVTQSLALPQAEKAGRVQAARRESDAYGVTNLFQQWAANLGKSAHVKNRLEEVYRE